MSAASPLSILFLLIPVLLCWCTTAAAQKPALPLPHGSVLYPREKVLEVLAVHRGPVRTSFSGPFQSSTAQPSTKYEKRSMHDFLTRDSRIGFIRKVYAIFSGQLATTAAIVYFIMRHESVAHYLLRHYDVVGTVSALGSLGIITSLISSPRLRYEKPWNFLLLASYTMFQAITIGALASLVDPTVIYLTTLHSLAVLGGILLYSLQPKPQFDLTTLGSGLLAILLAALTGSVLAHFFHFPLQETLLSGILAVVFACYITIDCQMIIGGRHVSRQYSPKEYILAALNLYQDVISLFLEILKISLRKKKEETHD
eukprot:gene10678-11845_t